MLKLYDYYRSSSAYRVRIALALKGLDYESIHIDLLNGAQNDASYKETNPQGFVPVLVDGDFKLTQSLAMIEYLDDQYGGPLLVHGDARQKARIRQMAQIVACEIAPLNIPKVWKGYVGKKLGADDAQMKDWFAHWIHEGFKAYETLLQQNAGGAQRFSCGDSPSLADLCLMPQLYNARRFHVDLADYPEICRIEKNCLSLGAFQKAAPESHAEAPADLEAIHGPHSPLLKAAT